MGASEITNCKLCKSEDVSDFVEAEEITYKGSTLQVSIAYYLCNNCDREFISKPQILQNEAALRAAKKDYDGLLSSEEIIRARRTLSLTQEQAARVFGGRKERFFEV